MPTNAGPTWRRRFDQRVITPKTSNQSTNYYNGFETGTPGAAITVSSQLGVNGVNGFGLVSNAVYSNQQSAHGNVSCYFQPGQAAYVGYNLTDGAHQVWFREYFYLTGIPVGGNSIDIVHFQYQPSSGNAAVFQITATGIAIQNQSLSNVGSAAGKLPTNTWLRAEGNVYGGPGGSALYTIFQGDTLTSLVSVTTSNQALGNSIPSKILFGSTFVPTYGFYIDDVAMATQSQSYIGPVMGQSPGISPGSKQTIGPVHPGQTWRRKFSHSTMSSMTFSQGSQPAPPSPGTYTPEDFFFIV
jgi:hypothetical protein